MATLEILQDASRDLEMLQQCRKNAFPAISKAMSLDQQNASDETNTAEALLLYKLSVSHMERGLALVIPLDVAWDECRLIQQEFKQILSKVSLRIAALTPLSNVDSLISSVDSSMIDQDDNDEFFDALSAQKPVRPPAPNLKPTNNTTTTMMTNSAATIAPASPTAGRTTSSLSQKISSYSNSIKGSDYGKKISAYSNSIKSTLYGDKDSSDDSSGTAKLVAMGKRVSAGVVEMLDTVKISAESAADHIKARVVTRPQTTALSGGPALPSAAHTDVKDLVPSSSTATIEVKIIIDIPKGVQVFDISTGGQSWADAQNATAESGGTKKVTRLYSDAKLQALQMPEGGHFLQCQDFLVPLVQATPCMRLGHRLYVFPSSRLEGASQGSGQSMGDWIGVHLPVTTPDAVVEALEMLLSETCEFCSPANATDIGGSLVKPKEWAEIVADKLEAGSMTISNGLLLGAVMGGNLIKQGGELLRKNLKSDRTAKKIDPAWHRHVEDAQEATHSIKVVTSYIGTQIQELTDRAISRLAPLMNDKLNEKLPKTEPNSERTKQALNVAKAGVRAAVNIYAGLEQAAIVLATELGEASHATVEHKYGKDAGLLAEKSLGVLKNTGNAVLNLKRVGLKPLMAKVAIGSTVEALEMRMDSSNSHHVPPEQKQLDEVDPDIDQNLLCDADPAVEPLSKEETMAAL